jgi:hypothetical protein
MPEQLFQITCALCSCEFVCSKLEEDELLCTNCGHSLDADHSGNLIERAEVI